MFRYGGYPDIRSLEKRDSELQVVKDIGCLGRPNATYFDVEKRSSSDVGYRRTNLLSRMDDVDSKRVHSIPTDVIAIDARNQYLTLVIVDEETTDHLEQPLITIVAISVEIIVIFLYRNEI